MRLAELASLQTELAARHQKAAPSVDLIDFKGLRGVADVTVEPKTGFISICGGTGTGKTALLETIYYALSSDDDPEPPSIDRIVGTQYIVAVRSQGQEYLASDTVSVGAVRGDGYPEGVRLVTLHDRTSFLQKSFLENDVEVLKEGVGATHLDASAVATLSLVCRKQYDSISYYEVEVEPGLFVPLFEVNEAGLIYDSRSMSTGELSAFYLVWACLVSEAYGVLLIEEPEAYMPPQSHRAIIGLLAKFALAKRLGIVATTHSTSIVSEVPENGIISLRREGNTSNVLPMGEDRRRALRRLGLVPSARSILLVEDQLAKAVLLEIITQSGIDDYSQFEVLIERDGASAIIAILEKFTVDARSVRLVGALDGDQRTNRDKAKLRYPALLLPFDTQMETELLEAVSSDLASLASSIGRDVESVRDAFAGNSGQDDHDRFRAIANILRVDASSLVRVAMVAWKSKSDRNAAALEAFTRELADLLK